MKFDQAELTERLIEAGVPEELHQEALDSLWRGFEGMKAVAPYKRNAWWKMFYLIFLTKKLRWEDDYLPEGWERYDNNISINGDQWGMIMPDGSHVSWYDFGMIARGETTAISYTDPTYKGTTYYAKKSHPRSKWARYVWLGWRNRASKYAMDLGELVDPQGALEVWGDEPEEGKSTLQFIRQGTVWQMRQQAPILWGLIDRGRNFGFKINNASVTHPRASVTWGFPTKVIRKKKK